MVVCMDIKDREDSGGPCRHQTQTSLWSMISQLSELIPNYSHHKHRGQTKGSVLELRLDHKQGFKDKLLIELHERIITIKDDMTL